MSPKYLLTLLLCCMGITLQAQDTKKALAGKNLFDTTAAKPKPEPIIITNRTTVIDTVKSASIMKKRTHDPRKATIKSALIPGWGQAYNREYWKIPIVYGALAIPVATFIFNNSYYKKTKFAYSAVYKATYGDHTKADSSDFFNIDKDVVRYTTPFTPYGLSEYQSSRNFYRQNRDYSVLWFLILWGVNVVDATVFGHLKHFDISDDLSMQVNPSFNTNSNSANVGLVFSFKKPEHRLKPLPEVK